MFWQRPRFKHHFRVDVAAGEDIVVLVSGREHHALEGKVYVALAPLLDGKHALDEIVDALDGEFPPSAIWFALTVLEKNGYITEETDALAPGPAAFWSAMEIDPALAGTKPAAVTIEIRALGGLSPAPLASLLRSMGLNVAAEGNLLVVLTDDYLREELAEVNEEAQRKNIPWALVKPTGVEAMIGPVFLPGKTACWKCLATRLEPNLMEHSVDKTGATRTVVPATVGNTPAGEQTVLGLAAMELAKWIMKDGASSLDQHLLTLSFGKPEIQSHAVQRLPQCPSCGNAGLLEARPLALENRLKTFTADGGHRIVRPLETYREYSHLVDSLTGLVNVVARRGEEDSQIHLYFAGENLALGSGHKTFKKLKKGLRTKSAGKGMTDAQAKASALCEALERSSGVYRGNEPTIRASYRELGEEAIHLEACQHFSRRQYEQRGTANNEDSFYYVPEPFDEEAAIEWTPVWSLTRKRFRYVPAEYCYFKHPEARFARGDSNGNASGNTIEEAVLQGFFELVERDCAGLWWYNRLRRPGVDLDSFGEPYYQELEAEYSRMGRRLWALDLTSDLGIPTFTAVSSSEAGDQILFGLGTHLDAKLALSRAITEMNQMLSSLDALKVSGGIEDPVALEWLKEANLHNQPYMAPDPEAPLKMLAGYTQPFHEDILEDISYCRKIVEGMGLEMLVLDQTRPDIGMPVAKVIVPGLRHFWARLAPGRLYDVPVQMGWLKRPNTEEELNPIPMFI